MSNLIVRTAVFIGALAGSPAALLQADVIYSDLGSGFYLDGGNTVSSDSGDLRPSVEFSPSVSEALIEVDFVTSIDTSTDPNDITVTLSSDAGGHPGAALGSKEFLGAMGISGDDDDDPPVIISWMPSTELDLVAGTEYWITLDGPADSGITWNYNLEGMSGYTQFQSGNWQFVDNTLGAIAITGGTPEPRTVVLLGLGLVAMIGIKSRCRDLRRR